MGQRGEEAKKAQNFRSEIDSLFCRWSSERCNNLSQETLPPASTNFEGRTIG